jgi:hypothetical protein
MGSFKNWLLHNEIVLGSDGMRDNAPAQTAKDTSQVAQKWLADPATAKDQANLTNLGQAHRSALNTPLLKAGSDAIKLAGPTMTAGVDAPAVGFNIQNSLKLPPILKPPTVKNVKMMRKGMRRS